MFVFGLSACSPGGLAGGEDDMPTSSSPKESALADVDPCSMLTPEEAAKFGFETPGEKDDILPSEPACGYSGDPFGGTVSLNKEKSVKDLSEQDNWARFDQTKVNGRSAATAVDASATDARICTTMFDAGGGVVFVDVTEERDKGLDECAESKKIAEAIEPRMPK